MTKVYDKLAGERAHRFYLILIFYFIFPEAQSSPKSKYSQYTILAKNNEFVENWQDKEEDLGFEGW